MLKNLLAAIALVGLVGGGAHAEDSTADARAAITAFVEAVSSGDPEVLGEVLAPEYQILRANGVGYDREGYLASDLPAIDPTTEWGYEDLVATAADGILVARYWLVIDETIDGEAVTRRAPRLTVFRRGDEGWLVVAHANFATPE